MDSRAPRSSPRRASFTCAAAWPVTVERKTTAAQRMSTALKALICVVPNRLTGASRASMQHHKTSTFIAERINRARRATLTGTVQLLWPYIWPADRADLKLRVFLAVALMLLSKLFTIAIPYSYKWATDAVAGKLALDAVPMPRLLIGAAALTVVYGVLRILTALTQQGRDALFAAVAMNAVRRLAIEVFDHLHRLSLRFHLERKTGGLTRVLERGRTAIETIIRTAMLTAVPTLVEFALVVAALSYSFDGRYVLVILGTVFGYLVFTTIATNWRISIRRSMNES